MASDNEECVDSPVFDYSDEEERIEANSGLAASDPMQPALAQPTECGIDEERKESCSDPPLVAAVDATSPLRHKRKSCDPPLAGQSDPHSHPPLHSDPHTNNTDDDAHIQKKSRRTEEGDATNMRTQEGGTHIATSLTLPSASPVSDSALPAGPHSAGEPTIAPHSALDLLAPISDPDGDAARPADPPCEADRRHSHSPPPPPAILEYRPFGPVPTANEPTTLTPPPQSPKRRHTLAASTNDGFTQSSGRTLRQRQYKSRPVLCERSTIAGVPPTASTPVCAPPALSVLPASPWSGVRLRSMAAFRFPFSWSASEAASCMPMSDLRTVTLTPNHIRVIPLIRCNNTDFEPAAPVILFGRRFDDPLTQSVEWLKLGWDEVLALLNSATREQATLIDLYLHTRASSNLHADSHPHTVDPPSVDPSISPATSAATLHGVQRLSVDEFDRLSPFAQRWSELLKRWYEIDLFFAYLNAFTRSTFFGRTALHDPTPAFTHRMRINFLHQLHQAAMDVFRTSTSMKNGLMPHEGVFQAAPKAKSFVQLAASRFMQFQMQVHTEILWLYDRQIIKYNMITLKRCQRSSNHDEHSTRGPIPNGPHPQPPSPTLDSTVFFPIFSYAEHLLQSLLSLAHRHPRVCTPVAHSDDGDSNDAADDDPTTSLDDASIQWVWHPVQSMWNKLKESLLAIDRCILYSRDDDMPEHLPLLWCHHLQADNSAIPHRPPTWFGTAPIADTIKVKRIESYRATLRSADSEHRPLLFNVLFQLVVDQLLQTPIDAHWRESEFRSLDEKDGAVNWTPLQQLRITQRATDLAAPPLHADVLAFTRRLRELSLDESPSRAASRASPNQPHLSLLDRIEVIFIVHMNMILPQTYHFETFLTELDGDPREVHRFLHPATPQNEPFDHSQGQIPATFSNDAIHHTDSRPFLLLPFMFDRAAVPTVAAAVGLTIDTFLRTLQCQVDWTLFDTIIKKIENTEDWNTWANRANGTTTVDAATRHAPSALSDRARLLYPILVLTRIYSIQRISLLTPLSLRAESRFLTDCILRSPFLMDIEHAVPDEPNKPSKAAGVTPFLLPHLFERDQMTPLGMGLEYDHTALNGMPLNIVLGVSSKSGGATRPVATRSSGLVDTFFSLSLKVIHQFMHRSFRPDSDRTRLFGAAPCPVSSSLMGWVASVESRTRQLATLFFVDKMMKKLKAPRRDANIAFNKLTLRNLTGPPPNSGVYFWHDAIHAHAPLARANLLALQRRLGMLLVLLLHLPRTLPSSFVSQKLTPLDVLRSIGDQVIASRPDESRGQIRTFTATTPQEPNNTHDIAEYILMRTFIAFIKIRQDYVDGNARAYREWMHHQPRRAHTPPSAPSDPTTISALSTNSYRWLSSSFDFSFDCGYDDILPCFLNLFFVPFWRRLMSLELIRRNRPPPTTTHQHTHTELEQKNKALDQTAAYLQAVLRIIEAIIQRRRHRWTKSELALLTFELDFTLASLDQTNPSAQPPAPAPGPAVAPPGRPVSIPALRDKPTDFTLFHQLLSVHGPGGRVPFILRTAAIAILNALLPTGDWTPAVSVTAAQRVETSSYMDDDDDDAFAAFDMSETSIAASNRRAEYARAAAIARAESDLAAFDAQLAAEHQARVVDQRAEYLRALQPILQRMVALLQQMLFSNLHDFSIVKKRILLQNRQHTSVHAAGVGSHRDSEVNPLLLSSHPLLPAQSAHVTHSSVTRPPPVTSLFHPLAHHLFTSDEFLTRIVDTLASIAHILVAQGVTQWKQIADAWFPIETHEPDQPHRQTHRTQTSDTKLTSFTIADLESPLKETLITQFYTALLSPDRFYRSSISTRALIDSPHVFLSLWLHRMVDFDVKLMRPTLNLTSSIMESHTFEWTGSGEYGRLIDFFAESREKILGWLRREEKSSIATATSSELQNPLMMFNWFRDKLRVVSFVIRAYARKFSPIQRLVPGSSSSAVGVGSSASWSSNHTSSVPTVFDKRLATLMRHNVETITERHTAQRGNVTAQTCAIYTDYLYAFVGRILEDCSDCLNPRSIPLSLTLVSAFTDNFIRLHPFGIKHVDAYRSSVACIPYVLVGYAAHVPIRIGAATTTEFQAEIAQSYTLGFTMRGQIHKLWTEYMHIIYSDPTRFKSTPNETIPPVVELNFNSTVVGSALDPYTALSLKDRLLDGWRRGLLGSLMSDAPSESDIQRRKSKAQVTRTAQLRFIRQYTLSLYATHAIGQSVLVADADARITWAHEILKELVMPILNRVEPEHFVFEFRSVLPGLLSALFECREFLPHCHPSYSPGSASAAQRHFHMSVNQAAGPWIMSPTILALKRTVLHILNAALIRCCDIAPYQHSLNPISFTQLFGEAPFRSLEDPGRDKFSGTILIHLFMRHMIHDLTIMIGEGEESIEPSVLSRDRATLISLSRCLSARHFTPSRPLADSFDRLTRELPRPAGIATPTATTTRPMPMQHLRYLDNVLQYFYIFKKLHRMQLESHDHPPSEITKPSPPPTHTPTPARSNHVNSTVNATPAVLVNPWSRSVVRPRATPHTPPNAEPTIPTPPAPTSFLSSDPHSLWSLSSSIASAMPPCVGVANRRWLSALLTSLRVLLDPNRLSPAMRRSETYRRIVTEYHDLIQTLDDDIMAMQLTLPTLVTQTKPKTKPTQTQAPSVTPTPQPNTSSNQT